MKTKPIYPLDDDNRALDAVLTEWTDQQLPVSNDKPGLNFLHRAREAARRRESLLRMQQAAEAVGFRALPMPDYLAQVARHARVNLGRLLLPHASATPPVTAWAALAKSIGIDRETIRLLVRLWVAHRQGDTGFNRVMARSGSDKNGAPHAFADNDKPAVETALLTFERDYDFPTQALLTSCLAQIET